MGISIRCPMRSGSHTRSSGVSEARCRPREKRALATIRSYADVVSNYVRNDRSRLARELDFYRKIPSLRDAIESAGLCKTSDGSKHRHQWRIKPAVLREAASKLQKAAHKIRECASFDELIRLIDQKLGCGHGLGELAKYDIAHRIGAHVGVYPKKVYLHRGTRAGAEALGLDGKLDTLEVSSLPREFRRLWPDEIEDCLCIYQGELASLAQGKFAAANHPGAPSCTALPS